MLRAIQSPRKYIQGQGEIDRLEDYAKGLGTQGAYAIIDDFILNTYGERIRASFPGGHLIMERFGGECSKQEIDRLMADVKDKHADVIIGIGGGKTLDTAKAVSFYLNLPVVIVPTAASTDAPCSALSVLYHENGEFDHYLILKHNPDLVLVDTEIIAKAPVRLLVAGMGDALATYYEAKANKQWQRVTMAGGIGSISAMTLAKACLDTLFEDGLKAIKSVENQCVTVSLENIVEANTFLSGVGFETGGVAAAHAIHNGFTVLPACHHMLHGEKVAFGTLAQLVLEDAPRTELEQVIGFCKEVGLPTTLAQLGAENPSRAEIMAVAEASCAEGETIHNMPFKVTPEDVCGAIYVADELGK